MKSVTNSKHDAEETQKTLQNLTIDEFCYPLSNESINQVTELKTPKVEIENKGIEIKGQEANKLNSTKKLNESKTKAKEKTHVKKTGEKKAKVSNELLEKELEIPKKSEVNEEVNLLKDDKGKDSQKAENEIKVEGNEVKENESKLKNSSSKLNNKFVKENQSKTTESNELKSSADAKTKVSATVAKRNESATKTKIRSDLVSEKIAKLNDQNKLKTFGSKVKQKDKEEEKDSKVSIQTGNKADKKKLTKKDDVKPIKTDTVKVDGTVEILPENELNKTDHATKTNQNLSIEKDNKIKDTCEISVVNEKVNDALPAQSKAKEENKKIVKLGADVPITQEKSDKKLSNGTISNKSNSPSAEGSSGDLLAGFASGNLNTKIKAEDNRSTGDGGDESSDKDISPIHTDSEGDKSSSFTESKNDISDRNITVKKEEISSIIKESLSKEATLESLVSTIVGALKSGGALNMKEHELATILSEATKGIEIPQNMSDESSVSIVQDIRVDSKEAITPSTEKSETIKDDSQIKNEEFQRQVRKVLAEGLVTTYAQAELVANLLELKFSVEDAVEAAAQCSNLSTAISYLQQECPLCANKCTINEMVGMLECDHRCCKECAYNYFNLQVTEASVWDCVCPFCRSPDLKHCGQDQAQLYFSHLDILLKGILSEPTHDLFQRKIRDWTLAQDPNFKWCTKCSSGFIANPNQMVLMCPDCRSITCARCRKPWEGGHEAVCEEAAEQAEPEKLLNKHLEEEGITCPSCKARYHLARGGCMHMTCTSCKHEFCSGCSKPFLMGDRCKVSEYCAKLGLHSHHPRNCLFYLRDKEPQSLEQLLKEHNVNFQRDESEAENTGRCKVNLLKETDDGMIEGECNHPIHAQALCRRHYIERLTRLIRQESLETLPLLSWEDMETIIRRQGRHLPPNPYGTPIDNYTKSLKKIVQEEIPLE